MNQDEFLKAKEAARQYSFMTARRRKLEKYKDVVLVHAMKEISVYQKLNITEQKKLAKDSKVYKDLMVAIKNCTMQEAQFQWKLLQFFNAAESDALEASFNRKNNWNIHNL